MAHIGLLDVDITPVDYLSSLEKEALDKILGEDYHHSFFGTVKSDTVALRIKVNYNSATLIAQHNYKIGDIVGVTVTSDTINNSSFYKVELIKTKSNSVHTVIGNVLDTTDYLIAIVPATTKKIKFYFNPTVNLTPRLLTSKQPTPLIDGTGVLEVDMGKYITKASTVDSFVIDPIYLEDSWDSDNLYANIYWTHKYDNSTKLLYDKILWYDIYCESSLLGSIAPVRVYYNQSNTYTHHYKLPGLLLQEHMRKVYENTNIAFESLTFSIVTVKAGLINSTKKKYSTTLYYKRPIYVKDMWVLGGDSRSQIKIRDDMTYTALSENVEKSTKIWDDRGDSYSELKLQWTASETPKKTKIKAYTYFGALSAKLDIFKVGIETDVSDKIDSKSGIFTYSYPAYLNRNAFEFNGTIGGATDYNGITAMNCTRYVAFEVTVYDNEGHSGKKRSQVIKIERRPIIRCYKINDKENGNKYYNYENGFNFNLFGAIGSGDLDNTEISWGIDRITVAEWLGIDLEKENKSFSELVSMYTNNFFNNVLTTYERTRNILSPVWFEMYLVIKSDYYFDVIDDEEEPTKKKIVLVSPFDNGYENHIGTKNELTYSKQEGLNDTHTPEYEYLIDTYDKDFIDWLLSADHQHHIKIDKDDVAFYESSSKYSLEKLQQIVVCALNKKGISIDFSEVSNSDELRYMFRRLLDMNYFTFRLYQFEYMPSIYLQQYPVHWECPVCTYKFVATQMDNDGNLYIFDGNKESSYYKSSNISKDDECNIVYDDNGKPVSGKFNTMRKARKYYECPNCKYTPNDYEIDTTPKWLQTLTNIDVGLPMVTGTKTLTYKNPRTGVTETSTRSCFDLYDYNNRLDKLLMGLFYAGNNTTANSYKVLYQLISQLFSGSFDGDSIETLLQTSSYTQATNSVNTSGITTFKQLFSAGSSYIKEFRDYYEAKCNTCGHKLYLDVLYTDGQKIKCPYCFADNISSMVKNDNENYMTLKEIGMAWQKSSSTVSDTDFVNFYHKMGTLDLDVMCHYCPTGKTTILNPNTKSELPIKFVETKGFKESSQEFDVSWSYKKKLGDISGFAICVGLAESDNQWHTSVNLMTTESTDYHQKIGKFRDGYNEYIEVPLNSSKKCDTLYYISYMMLSLDDDGNVKYDNNSQYGCNLTFKNTKNSVDVNGTITFNFSNYVMSHFKKLADFYGVPKTKSDDERAKSLMSDSILNAIDGDGNKIRISVEIRPFFRQEGIKPNTAHTLFGKSRKYKKNDDSNFNGDNTEYGVMEYNSSYADITDIILTGVSTLTPIFPDPFSTNIYNITPTIDKKIIVGETDNEVLSPYTGNYHWISDTKNATLVYELTLPNIGGNKYTVDFESTNSPLWVLKNNILTPIQGKEIGEQGNANYTFALVSANSEATEFDELGIYENGNIVKYNGNTYKCSGIRKPSVYTESEIQQYWVYANSGIGADLSTIGDFYYLEDTTPINNYDSDSYVHNNVLYISPSRQVLIMLDGNRDENRYLKLLSDTSYSIDDIIDFFFAPQYMEFNKSEPESQSEIFDSIIFDSNRTYGYFNSDVDYEQRYVVYDSYMYKYVGTATLDDYSLVFGSDSYTNSSYNKINSDNVLVTKKLGTQGTKFGDIVVDDDYTFYTIDRYGNNIQIMENDITYNTIVIDSFAYLNSSENTYTFQDLHDFIYDGENHQYFTKLKLVYESNWEKLHKYTYSMFKYDGSDYYYYITDGFITGAQPKNSDGSLNKSYVPIISCVHTSIENEEYYTQQFTIRGLVSYTTYLVDYNKKYYKYVGNGNSFIIDSVTNPSHKYWSEIEEFSTNKVYTKDIDTVIYDTFLYRCNVQLARYKVSDLSNYQYWIPVDSTVSYIPIGDNNKYSNVEKGTYYLIIRVNSDLEDSSIYDATIKLKCTHPNAEPIYINSKEYVEGETKESKIRPNLNIHFINSAKQDIKIGDTIYADIMGHKNNDIISLKKCPKCGRVHSPKIGEKSLYYYFNEDYETLDAEFSPILYSKFDSIRRDTIKDIDTKYSDVNTEFNSSFGGINCVECDTELVDVEVKLDNTDTSGLKDYRGSYWVAREIESFNGWFGNHTPTYADIQRGKYIVTNPYEYIYENLRNSADKMKNYTDIDTYTMRYGEFEDIEIPTEESTINNDTAIDGVESSVIENVLYGEPIEPQPPTPPALHKFNIQREKTGETSTDVYYIMSLNNVDNVGKTSEHCVVSCHDTGFNGFDKNSDVFINPLEKDVWGDDILYTNNITPINISDTVNLYHASGETTQPENFELTLTPPTELQVGTRAIVVENAFEGRDDGEFYGYYLDAYIYYDDENNNWGFGFYKHQ